MALGDITILREGQFGGKGARRYLVQASATTIKAGEPVAKALGTAGSSVTPAVTSSPEVGTHYLVGIAATTSTNTASLNGTVDVFPLSTDTVYLISPKTAATWDTQSEYDALVGDRVTFDLTTSTYTINATDGVYGGLVIEPLDISKYPGKVAFSIRAGVAYNA